MNLAQFLGMSDPPSAPIRFDIPTYRLLVRKEIQPEAVRGILSGLQHSGPATINQLAARLGRSKGYVRVTLAGMYAHGLVKRQEGRIKGAMRYIWSALP